MSDILKSIKAIYTQEENCLKLELIYNNAEDKNSIHSAIEETLDYQEYRAEISDNDESKDIGFICIKLFNDHNKKSKLLLDTLISKLGL